MNRSLLKWIGFVALGIAAFLLFIWLSLPIDLFRGALEHRIEAALGDEYDVTILDMSLSGLTAIELEGIELRRKPPAMAAQPAAPGEAPPKFKRVTMNIDRVEVDFALFKSLLGDTTVNFVVEQGDGRIDGSWSHVPYEPLPSPKPAPAASRRTPPPPRRPGRAVPKPTEDEDAPAEDAPTEADEASDAPEDGELLGHQVDIAFDAFPLGSIALIEGAIGMPLIGKVTGETNLLFSHDGQLLDGAISLNIERVALGPGEIPIDTPLGYPEVKDAIRFGTLAADIKIEGGKMEVETLETTGPDVILEANGNITLARKFGGSRAKLNARIKPSNEFLDKSALTIILNQNSKARRAKAGDWYGLLINGSLSDLGKGEGIYPSSRTASGLGKAGK